ncbi:MAG: translocation/assembly module TamB domain-containing protein [Roseovarius sp.]
MARLILVLALTLAALAAPLLAQSSDEDRGYLQSLLEDNLSGAGRDVRIIGFAGALSSRATIEALTIADREGIWITLHGITLDWTRSALLRGRVEINRLTAREIILARAPIAEEPLSPEMAEAAPFRLPDLPVSVNIGEISAEILTLGAPLLGEEIDLRLLGRLSLGGGEGAAEIDVTRLDGRGAVTLDASFVNATQMLALDLSLQEDAGGIAATLLQLPGQPALALDISGTAPLNDYTADIRLASDGTPRLSGQVTIRDQAVEGVTAQVFGATLSGDLTPLFAAEYRPFFGTESALDLTGTRQPNGALDIADFTLSTAQISLKGALSLDAAGWPQRFALNGQLGDGATRVRLPISGPATHIRGATIDAAFDAARGDRWRVRLGLSGLDRPDLDLASASLSGRGAVTRAAPRGVTALVEFDLAGLRLDDPALAEAAGDTLSGLASLDFKEGRPLILRALRVVSGAVRLSGNGQISTLSEGFPVSGTVTLETPDLARFAALAGQDIAGAAKATISGAGSLLGGDFDITVDAQTADLAIGIAQVDPLIASAGTLSLAAVRDTTGIALDRLQVENEVIRATASGRLNGESGALTLAARLTDLALSDPRLSGPAEISSNIAWQTGGDVTLTGLDAALMGSRLRANAALSPEVPGLPMSGTLSAEITDLARFNALVGQPLRGALDLTLEGKVKDRGQDVDASITLDGRDLRTGITDLDKLLAGRLTFTAEGARRPDRIEIGTLRLETSQLTLSGGSPDPGAPVEFSARLANLGLFAPDFAGPVTATGRATLTGDLAQRIALTLSAEGPGGTTAQVSGDIVDHGARLDVTANGALPLALANGIIRPNTLQGTARYDLRINGAPALPAVSGTISTTDTRVALPATGLAVDNLSGTATLGQSRVQTDFTARMRDGGQIRVTGPIGLTPGFSGDLEVGLAGLVLSDQVIYTTTVNGNIGVSGPLTGGARISGALTLEETNIRVPSGLGPTSVSLPDLQHRNEPAAVRETRQRAGLIQTEATARARPFLLNMSVNAPNRIFVRGRGIDAELGGSLRLAGTSEAVAPDGFFELIRGRIDILGQRLTMTEGRITMQGSLDPYLRFVATTDADDVNIQVIVEGLASAPEVRFASDPDLPQEEVVSRLIFRRGLDNISAFQAAQMASAVATLTGNSNADVVGKLRGAIGLSDLDVTQTTDGGTQVSAGAYISDKVYTEVTADSEGKQRINLNFDLSDNITIKGGASNDGASGLGVFFERDY